MSFDVQRRRDPRAYERELAAREERRSKIVWLTAAAGIACAIGTAALAFGDDRDLNLLGYLIGSLVPLGLVAAARRSSAEWEQQSGSQVGGGLRAAMLAILLVAVVSAGVHAYFVSRHLPL